KGWRRRASRIAFPIDVSLLVRSSHLPKTTRASVRITVISHYIFTAMSESGRHRNNTHPETDKELASCESSRPFRLLPLDLQYWTKPLIPTPYPRRAFLRVLCH